MNHVATSPVPSSRRREFGLFDDRKTHAARGQSHAAIDEARSMLAETPDGNGFIELLKAFRRSGGTVPSGVFGALFAQRQSEGAPRLQTLIERGDVFAFEWRADLWIPLFQFDADDFSIKVSAREVRSALPVCWSAWRVATWFVQPHSFLGDCSPVDVLGQGKGDVIRAARSISAESRVPVHV